VTELVDQPARLRALTDLDATLLVEAAAGTGKTSLIAGRLTVLLASGASPASIAAITFTELAASELSVRVHRYVEQLLAGELSPSLLPAFPLGLRQAHRTALVAAAAKLDELTITTIHAFCQTIICSYAVEADIDPGAQILDATQAEAAFDAIFGQWLRRRLGDTAPPGDTIATLSRDEPRRVVRTLHELARFHANHRGARTPAADLSGRPDIGLVEAVGEFRRWATSVPPEPKTSALLDQLELLSGFYAKSFDPLPDFPRLWALAHPPQLTCMRKDSFELLRPRHKSAWDRAAGKERGSGLNAESEAHFQRIDECFRVLLGKIATAVVGALSQEIGEVLADYAAFKRAAAVLDFDDLLERAGNLVRGQDAVRRALGERYRHIFVDEFQDTDPLQTEILFRIAGAEPAKRWQDVQLRAGSLFVVGDPKQAIYRFRGADVGSYAEARTTIERLWPDNVLQVTANFRSRPSILDHVNRCFAPAFGVVGQPDYVALTATVGAPDHNGPCVGKITVEVQPGAYAADIRDSEARTVADLCHRLLTSLRVRGDDGALVPLTPGGIVLLAPTTTDLWRYERALEERDIPFASQAGRNLFRRQEVQDLLALARTLADPRDTMAFGALMRGPLVGLSEEELLDVAAALPADPDRPGEQPRFSISTNADQVSHPIARQALGILQELRRRVRSLTPSLLLAEAMERLMVRPVLASRGHAAHPRAVANVEAFLERAKPYNVRGLKAFVRDATRDWREGAPRTEGRVDSEGDAIQIMTVHGAKGLEWPVVIPINTGSEFRRRDRFVHRSSDDTLHWLVGEVAPPQLMAALAADDESAARERERLWYVACTRARDLLVVPELGQAQQKSWARVLDLGCQDLPVVDPPRGGTAAMVDEAPPANTQSQEVFAAERAKIAEAAAPLAWLRPSAHDADRAAILETAPPDGLADAPEVLLPVGAGRIRGLALHKLMEEVLTGETAESQASLRARASVLIAELAATARTDSQLPDAREIASTVLRTFQLPDIAALRPHLMAEVPIYTMVEDGAAPTALAGRIDAMAVEDRKPQVVVDWKSDVGFTEKDVSQHVVQLRDYLTATGAPRGALVYMSTGLVRWL
jgi:ATP-dependent exoDNAse (exonuclease V) beta subunit